MTEQNDETLYDEEAYVELTRVSDPVAADLLAAFLSDSDLEFDVINRTGTGLMGQLVNPTANPVLFLVRKEDAAEARELLAEYHRLQAASVPPDPDAESDDAVQEGTGDQENG